MMNVSVVEDASGDSRETPIRKVCRRAFQLVAPIAERTIAMDAFRAYDWKGAGSDRFSKWRSQVGSGLLHQPSECPPLFAGGARGSGNVPPMAAQHIDDAQALKALDAFDHGNDQISLLERRTMRRRPACVLAPEAPLARQMICQLSAAAVGLDDEQVPGHGPL